MGALTPARPALRILPHREHRPFAGQVSLLNTARTSMHSVIKHLTRPVIAFLLLAQRDGLPGARYRLSQRLLSASRSGLRLESAGSSHRAAESCSSLSYGLHVRFRLLPTPPRGDAVTFSYRDRASPERGLSPLCSRLLAGARTPVFTGVTILYEFINLGRMQRAFGGIGDVIPLSAVNHPQSDTLPEAIPALFHLDMPAQSHYKFKKHLSRRQAQGNWILRLLFLEIDLSR